MNRKFLLSGIILLNLVMAPTFSMAADTTVINIKANIVASSCAVETDTLNIDLGDIDVRGLSGGGATSPWSDIQNIKITDCPAGVSTVKATFSGTPGDYTGSYKNMGTAKNVAVILGDDKSDYNSMWNGSTLELPVASGGVSIPVRARLYSESLATVGTVEATVNVAFEYK